MELMVAERTKTVHRLLVAAIILFVGGAWHLVVHE